MKTIIQRCFIMFTFLLISELSMAQSDSIVKPDGSSDSLGYVIPVASRAELSYITAPEGFEVSKSFNGYIHNAASTAIIMTIIDDVTYNTMDGTMTDAYFNENKLNLISKSKVLSQSGVHGFKYKFSFTTGEREFIRYMVWAGDLNKTLWLNITYPKLDGELVESEILNSINSINFNTPGK